MTTITPFLWYVDNAEPAIERYLEVFHGELVDSTRGPDGALFIGSIRLHGQLLTLMNGGPDHRLSPAFSLSVILDSQDEIDRVSAALIEGGGEQGPCGWLTDAFGLSWQIVPSMLPTLMGDPDPQRSGRVREALMQMTRISVRQLEDAYHGATIPA